MSTTAAVFASGRDSYLCIQGDPAGILALVGAAEHSLDAINGTAVQLTGQWRQTSLEGLVALRFLHREGPITISCVGEVATLAGDGSSFTNLFEFLRQAVAVGPQTWEFLGGSGGWIEGIDPGSHLDVQLVASGT